MEDKDDSGRKVGYIEICDGHDYCWVDNGKTTGIQKGKGRTGQVNGVDNNEKGVR